MKTEDAVNHPKHYCNHKSGVECIEVSETMNFNVGNAFKYLFRCGDKGRPVEDMEKACWYLEREIARRQRVFWFAWEDDGYDARFDGAEPVKKILAYEIRYFGHMTSALERICTAAVQPRSLATLRHAVRKVRTMIDMEKKSTYR